MNSNKKIALIAGGVILLLLFVFAGVMLFRGIRQFGTAEKNLASARSQLNSFYKRDPFPVGKNVATVRKNSEMMDEWLQDIVDVAKRKQVDPAETRSPSVFINMLAKIRNGLQAKAKHEGIGVSEEFGFGFDRYVAGQPATADHVPRLIQQLLIVNEICGILIDEKVKDISMITREQFEGVSLSSSTGARRVVRRRPTVRRTGGEGSPARNLRRAAELAAGAADTTAGQFDDESTYAKMKFSFDFSAREANVLNILNRIAQNEMFIVITAVDIESTTPEAAVTSDEKKDSRAQGRTTVPRRSGQLKNAGAIVPRKLRPPASPLPRGPAANQA